MTSRRDPLSGNQKRMLLDILQQNPKLRAGTFSSDFTYKKSQEMWQSISERLNAIPGGAKKDWKSWKKTWQDLKKHATSKNSQQKKEYKKTGGGSPVNVKVDIDDEMILNMISKKKLEGLGGVVESEMVFEFEDPITTPKPSRTTYWDQPSTSLATDSEIINTPKAAKSESKLFPNEVIIIDDNCNNTDLEDEHGYSLKFPDDAHPKKKYLKHVDWNHHSKFLNKCFKDLGKKMILLRIITTKKLTFMNTKKNDDKILKAMEENNRVSSGILKTLTETLIVLLEKKS